MPFLQVPDQVYLSILYVHIQAQVYLSILYVSGQLISVFVPECTWLTSVFSVRIWVYLFFYMYLAEIKCCLIYKYHTELHLLVSDLFVLEC